MSSLTHLLPPSAAPASTSQKSHRLLTPTTNPIPLLSSALTQRYSIVHTFLVPLYYYVRGSYLVADPYTTLLRDLAVVAILQCAFCAVCLPQAGAWVSGTSGGPILEGTSSSAGRAKGKGAVSGTGSLRRKGVPGGGVGSKVAVEGSWGARVMPTLFSLILTLTLPPVPLTLIALVLGAPLYPTSSLPLTLLLSLHVSVLGFLPLFYTHGVSATAWRDVSAAWLPFDSAGAWGGSVGAFVGGWVGAIPMALDWDREWQEWPCTVVWGVVAGWMMGRVLTGVLGWGVGRRIDLSEKEEEEIVLVERRNEDVVGREKEEGKKD